MAILPLFGGYSLCDSAQDGAFAAAGEAGHAVMFAELDAQVVVVQDPRAVLRIAKPDILHHERTGPRTARC